MLLFYISESKNGIFVEKLRLSGQTRVLSDWVGPLEVGRAHRQFVISAHEVGAAGTPFCCATHNFAISCS